MSVPDYYDSDQFYCLEDIANYNRAVAVHANEQFHERKDAAVRGPAVGPAAGMQDGKGAGDRDERGVPIRRVDAIDDRHCEPGPCCRYVFTLNNPQERAWPDIEEIFREHRDCIKYLAGQSERAPSTGTYHIQGIIHFRTGKAQRPSGVRNIIPGAWVDRQRGTNEQARAYAMKEETRLPPDHPFYLVFEYGEMARGRGDRSDLRTYAEACSRTHSLAELADEFPTEAVRYHSFYARIRQELNRSDRMERDIGPLVMYFHGATGTGKSSAADAWFHRHDIPYYCYTTGARWNNYRGERGILFDEWCPNTIDITELLRVLDFDGSSVNVKYGESYVCPDVVIITAQYAANMFPESEGVLEWRRYEALRRRISLCLEFRTRGRPPFVIWNNGRLRRHDRNLVYENLEEVQALRDLSADF